MKLMVGLGNPGPLYARTRHNLGYRVIEEIADKTRSELTYRDSLKALTGEVRVGEIRSVIAKPLTYMNQSGLSVRALASWYQTDVKDIVIICDDLNLDVGKLRIRPKGSDGGHNGLKSIISCLGTSEFPRIRIGIGEPKGDAVDYVLSPFSRQEEETILEAIVKASQAAIMLIEKNIELVMNRYN
jgi:PTH1 family peptidyl-tRNA hydrolase